MLNKNEYRIREWIDTHKSAIVEYLKELISIPTINPPGMAYRECVDSISQQLRRRKISYRLIEIPEVDYPRYSLVGEHGTGKAGLHFHGHYDVVPEQSSEQFKPFIRGDRLFGRGSADMKSGLVVMLFAMFALQDLSLNSLGKISFSIVPDEETGGKYGTLYLFKKKILPMSSMGMLMPEPTSGIVWGGSKGALTLRIKIKGKPAHVALEDQGINAFEKMVEVASSILELKRIVKKRKTNMFINPPEACRSSMLLGGQSGSGKNFNVVPDTAFFTIDRRLNPEEDLKKARQEILDVVRIFKRRGYRIEVDEIQQGESSEAPMNSMLAKTLKSSIQDVVGKIPSFELCPGLCEIRFFNQRRIPAYAYGPGLLEIAHTPHEYVNINNIIECTNVYAMTALKFFQQ